MLSNHRRRRCPCRHSRGRRHHHHHTYEQQVAYSNRSHRPTTHAQPLRHPYIPNKVLAVRAERRLLEESRYKSMILHIVDVLLLQRTFAAARPHVDLLLLLLGHVVVVSHLQSGTRFDGYWLDVTMVLCAVLDPGLGRRRVRGNDGRTQKSAAASALHSLVHTLHYADRGRLRVVV